MEYFAKIIQEKKSRMLWQYTFMNTQTGEVDCFYNNERINYVSDFEGRLELSLENSKQHKVYQSFTQDIVNTVKKFQQVESLETITQLGEELEKSVSRVDNNLGGKKIKVSPQCLNKLHQSGFKWKELAIIFGISIWTIQRLRKLNNKTKQKVGRKQKINGNNLAILQSYIFANNTSTQRDAIDYLYQETGYLVNQSTISRTLKRENITYKKATNRYSEQITRMGKIENFIDTVKPLLSNPILALDECSFHLNETPRCAYSRKGLRASTWKPGKKGSNHSLILCVQNTKEKGVIYYQLIEGGVKSQSFHDFLAGINLTTNENHYLLLDNAKIHHSTWACRKLQLPTVKEQLTKKNIQPLYLPPYTPQLNPTELCFNFIRKYVEKNKPRNYEKLKLAITEAIENLQKKDLTKFFQHCLNYNFVIGIDS